MKLTRKKAIELCIELWTWLAKTGKYKEDWPKWKEYGKKLHNCWFCAYKKMCSLCPYYQKYGHCNSADTYYNKWKDAKTSRTRKKYAKLFLAQIKTLK